MREQSGHPAIGEDRSKDFGLECGQPRVSAWAWMRYVNHHVMRNPACVQHDHPVGKRHRLGHVMRYQHGGKAVVTLHLQDQILHHQPRQGVQGPQRLIQSQKAGAADQSARKGYSLALSARQA